MPVSSLPSFSQLRAFVALCDHQHFGEAARHNANGCRKTIDQIRTHKRMMNIVSRGGSLVFAWMSMTGEAPPSTNTSMKFWTSVVNMM